MALHDRRVRHERLGDVAAVAVPTALALFLCFYEISSRSLWLDEAASVAIASQHGHALGSAIAHDGGNMSAYYLLLHVVIGVFGKGALAIRFTAALAGAAAVCLTAVLGLRLFGRRVALAAGLLAAVSLPLVFWGQNARAYALVIAFVCASFLAFAELLRRDGRGQRAWIAYVVCTALAMYMSVVAVLVVPAQLVVLLWRRQAVQSVVEALILAATLCVPLAVLAVNRGSGQLFWVPRPDLTSERQSVESLASASYEPNFRSTSTTVVLLVITGVVLLAGVALIVRSWRRGDWRALWPQGLVLSWMLVPPLLAWLESLVGQSIFVPRNLLVSLPAVALMLAWTIADVTVPSWVCWPALAVLLALRALQVGPSYAVSPEDWRTATAYVLDRARAGDCIAFYPSDARMPFQYYVAASAATGRAPRSVLPAVPWSVMKPYVEVYATLGTGALARLRADCERMWLVWSHQGQRRGTSGSRADYARWVRLRTALQRELGGAGRSVSFGYAAPVTVQLFAGRGRAS